MESNNLRLTLHEDTPIDEYLEDGVITEFFTQSDGTYQIIINDVDDVLIESLDLDELCGFFGIDSEFVIAVQVLEYA